jgi:hypothetical protein
MVHSLVHLEHLGLMEVVVQAVLVVQVVLKVRRAQMVHRELVAQLVREVHRALMVHLAQVE